MKKLSLFILFSTALLVTLGAQTVPQGMNYQAAARGAKGNVLADQEVTLRISLLADGPNGKVLYSELHDVTTSSLGLFDLVIGQGLPESGSFVEIPWSKAEVWMDIALDENGSGEYTALGASRLMAVPYALHAGTAENVAGAHGTEKAGGKWRLDGNDGIDEDEDYLGTSDDNPLSIRTDGQERIRVAKDGDVAITTNLDVAGNVDATSFTGDGSGLTGINVSDADSDPTNELQSWSTLPGIPADIVDGDHVNDADADPTNELELPGANPGDMAYFDGTGWQRVPAGMEGQVLTMSGGTPTWASNGGDNGGGGDPPGSPLQVTLPSGEILYVHPTDNVQTIIWGAPDTDIPGLPNIHSDFNGFVASDFNGEANTQAIVSALGNFNNGFYAAKVCYDLVAFGFDDWYLPGGGELNAIYQQIGPTDNGFGGSGDIPAQAFGPNYWSSTESFPNNAWWLRFSNGFLSNPGKGNSERVRCVRK